MICTTAAHITRDIDGKENFTYCIFRTTYPGNDSDGTLIIEGKVCKNLINFPFYTITLCSIFDQPPVFLLYFYHRTMPFIPQIRFENNPISTKMHL